MAQFDTYQLTVVQLLGGKEISNVFYYTEAIGTALPPATLALQLSAEFYTNIWLPFWKPHISSKLSLSAIWAQRIWPTSGVTGVQIYNGEPGTVAGDSVPNNACALIRYRSNEQGRWYQRLSYISGIPESRTLSSELNVVGIAGMFEYAEAVVDTILIPSGDPAERMLPGSFSKKLAADMDPKPWASLVSWFVHHPIRSQRGRNLVLWKSAGA